MAQFDNYVSVFVCVFGHLGKREHLQLDRTVRGNHRAKRWGKTIPAARAHLTHTLIQKCVFVKTQPLLNTNAFIISFFLFPVYLCLLSCVIPDVTQRTVTLVTHSEEHVIVSTLLPLHLGLPYLSSLHTHTACLSLYTVPVCMPGMEVPRKQMLTINANVHGVKLAMGLLDCKSTLDELT